MIVYSGDIELRTHQLRGVFGLCLWEVKRHRPLLPAIVRREGNISRSIFVDSRQFPSCAEVYEILAIEVIRQNYLTSEAIKACS